MLAQTAEKLESEVQCNRDCNHREDFLVTVSIAGREKKVIWDPRHRLPLNHPVTLVLEHSDCGFQVRELSGDRNCIEVDESVLTCENWMRITDDHSSQEILLRIRRLRRNSAAYLPENRLDPRRSFNSNVRLFAMHGIGEALSVFEPFGSSRYTATLEGHKVFSLKLRQSGPQIVSHVSGLVVEFANGMELKPLRKAATLIAENELGSAIIRFGQHWWRVKLVPFGDLPGIDETSETELVTETAGFRKILGRVAVSTLVMVGLVWLMPPSPPKKPVVEQAQPVVTTVHLKRPTVVAKKPEPPKPKPTPKPVEVAKVQPKKPVPVSKKVAVHKPQPRKVQPQKVVKTRLIQPFKLAQPQRPAPRQPVVDLARAAALATKAKQAQVSKTLSFLSTVPARAAKGAVALPSSEFAKTAKYRVIASAAAGPKSNSVLLAMATVSDAGNRFIDTKGAQAIAADTGIRRSKSLNNVQGKVALTGVYDPNGAARMGTAISSNQGGLTMSGEGSISEGELLKILSRYLQKFQYCYEKALLSNPSIAGSLLMQWTIRPAGSASEVKVVRSQLNHSGLHGCISTELSRISFPSPKGGSVTIRYPFSFSSTAL